MWDWWNQLQQMLCRIPCLTWPSGIMDLNTFFVIWVLGISSKELCESVGSSNTSPKQTKKLDSVTAEGKEEHTRSGCDWLQGGGFGLFSSLKTSSYASYRSPHYSAVGQPPAWFLMISAPWWLWPCASSFGVWLRSAASEVFWQSDVWLSRRGRNRHGSPVLLSWTIWSEGSHLLCHEDTDSAPVDRATW